ncbi:glycosyltransferase family 2 protein [Jejuia pallidilutea]
MICTYMRPKALVALLDTVNTQTKYPNQIIIVDGSVDMKTEAILSGKKYENLVYFKVDNNDRGLTKQRNFGIRKVDDSSKIICFLDDDVTLEANYFEELLTTYKVCPDALAVGGYITNEVNWEPANTTNDKGKFYIDGWQRSEPTRFKVRRWFGLLPDTPPAVLPTFGHGRSVSFLPPSGNIYEVEQIMGGVSSYRKDVFEKLTFSTYFEGYGLYEDTDFSLRIAKIGKLYVNTNAKLAHYHEPSGRPNYFKYGVMVIRNGWYVWRVKYPKPSFRAIIKFHATSFLLTLIRASNILTSKEKKKALTETLGRISGWFSLIYNKPKLQ